MTHRNIALVGFMGSGKSVVGHTLAQRLAWKFVDIDAEIVHEQKKSIPALFKEQGEEPFRDIEEKVIERVCLGSNQVISTGGGALIRQSNIDCLRKNSWLVCLWVSA
ncbi:MAG: shikimate kinase, partial [Verrucomicrobiota bacterium]|nr:shikimate kinase [Verrucomicrobiota bacterium]